MDVTAVYKNWQGRVRRVDISQVRDVDALRTALEKILGTNVVVERRRR